MDTTTPSIAPERRDEITALIEQRAVLKGWLLRLADHGAEVPAHVVERVRADYLDRLQRTTEQLTPHLEGLRQDLTELREQWEAAAARHSAAVDALEEGRLRQLIGEIGDETWREQEPELSAAVEAEAAEQSRLEEEVDRIAAVVTEIEGELSAAAPLETPASEFSGDSEVATVPAEDVATAAAASLPDDAQEDTLPDGFPPAERSEPAAEWSVTEESDEEESGAEADEVEERGFRDWLPPEEEFEVGSEDGEEEDLEGDDGLAFLEELDRAIAAAGGAVESPSSGTRRGNGHGSAATAQEVRYCRACGSDNDIRAWYCEICGEELS